MIFIPDYIKTLKSYKPGNALKGKGGLSQIEKFINLASNENPLGPSPKAANALIEAAGSVSLYPDVHATELVSYLSEKLNKKTGQIISGHGSDSLIADIIKSFSEHGDEIMIGSGTFIGYFVNIQKLGRKTVSVLLKNYAYDLDAMLKAITKNTRVIFLANPNNPTGLMINKKDLDAFIEKVPEDVLIVIDEAYSIYSEILEGYPNCLEYNRSNLIVLRTLSKSHGLAGIRIGFAVGPEELIGTLYKVKLPFEPNIIAQKIARAALEDEQFVFETVKLNTITLSYLKAAFDESGIKYCEPAGNFVMIQLGSEKRAKEFTDKCYEKGILVRHLPPFGLPDCVRISTGLLDETKHAVEVFKSVIKEI